MSTALAYHGRLDGPRIKKAEEAECLRAWFEKGDVRARDRVIRAHLWLARYWARKFSNYRGDYDELFSAACEGLMVAMIKFDIERGLRFSTYARHWVYAHVVNHIVTNWTGGKTGSGLTRTKHFFRARRVRARLMCMYGDVSVEKIAEKVKGLRPEQLLRMDTPDQPLEHVSDDGDEWECTIPAPGPSPLEEMEDDEVDDHRSEVVQLALMYLDPRERRIIRERYLDEESKTLSQLGRDMGISRERVRQIEARAIKKFKAHYGKRGVAMSEALKTTRRIVEIEQELEKMGGLQDQYTELIRQRLREIERQLDRKETLEQEQDELMTRLRKLTGEAPPIGRPRGKKKKSRPKKRPARLSPGQAQVLEYLRAESGNTKWLDRDDVIAHCNKYEAKTVGLYLHLLRRRGLAEDDGKYRWRSKEQQDG